MKKFLAVFDGFKLSNSTLQYAIQITKSEKAHLVGVFLDDLVYRSYSVYKVITNDKNYKEKLIELDVKDQQKRNEAALKFQKACEDAKISFSIHRDKNIAIQDLKHESLFADLVIINEYETFTKLKEHLPTRFIKDLLTDVPCPVLVTPGIYKKINKVVLLYDCKPYALYAIKMFSYLSGGMNHLPIEVFTVKDSKMGDLRLPDNKLMKEFIKRHFPHATYTVVKGNPELEIVKYLRSLHEDVLVALGAYQRSDLSRWFKTSMADILMKETELPLFIAHSR
ncbi:MAG: universal stress protein [Ginsengibacter sp.]